MKQVSPLRQIIRFAVTHRYYWFLPLAGSIAAATCWTVWHKPTWEASQGLIIRDVTSLENADLGRFPDGESRKIAQEMVLELARRPEVARATLLAVGPPAGETFPHGQPTRDQQDSLADGVKVTAPKGAEFGRTDLIYLSVKDHSPARARQLATALTTAVDHELRQLRKQQAASLVAELTQVESVAKQALERATAELVELERQAGPDLGELRVLTQAGSGEGVVRQLLVNLDNDRRAVQIKLERQRNLLQFLSEAQRKPEVILSAPNALFELQPSLGGLKQGLTRSQLQLAQLKGQYAEAHPKVQAATATVREVRERLRQALESAATALAQDVHLNESQLALLEDRRQQLLRRSERIAKLRAPYAARMENVRQATLVLQEVRKNLSEARGRLQAADDTSLITRVGKPATGNQPTGPQAAVVLLAAVVGGLLLGAGNLALMLPTSEFGRQTTTEDTDLPSVPAASLTAGHVDDQSAAGDPARNPTKEPADKEPAPSNEPPPGVVVAAAPPFDHSTTTQLPSPLL